jgi:hypothetical protein
MYSSYNYPPLPKKQTIHQLALLQRCIGCGAEKPYTSKFFEPEGEGLRKKCKVCRSAYHKTKPRKLYLSEKGKKAKRREWDKKEKGGYPPAPSHYWTTIRAAIELEISETTLLKWVREGKVTGIRHLKRSWRFDPIEIQKKAKELGL